MYHDYAATSATLRGFVVPASADDFVSLTLPADYQLGGTVGGATQVIERSSDRSVSGTVTTGTMSLGHVLMAQAYAQQEATRAAGGSPVGAHSFILPNGDTVAGIGVIVKPDTLSGGVASGSRSWRVLLQEATFTPAVGLAANLTAAGTV